MGHDKDHPLDCTESHVGCEDSEAFDATTGQHGLMSKVDKIKLDGLANLSFGAWTDEDSNTDTLVKDAVYQVTSDGFVSVIGENFAGSPIAGYTDGSNPPTTLRLRNMFDYNYGQSWTLPVKNGDYWKIISALRTPVIHWLPIGSGECEIQV